MSYKNIPSKGILVSLILAISVAGQSVAAEPAKPAAKAPLTYRIAGADRRASNFDARAEIQGYTQLVADTYAAALADAESMRAAINAFLATPDDNTLTRARDAWVNARRSWLLTEAFRFYDGPIDAADNEQGPLTRLDGWPVDPAAIDYVEDNPTAGIINDMKQALTRQTLIAQVKAGHPVTGWHAIEFLLWGQEPAGAIGDPGDRPVTDFLPNQPNNDRRRTYLKLTADMLIDDMHYLVESWDPKSRNSYAAAFRLLNHRDALGRIMNGIAQLAGPELATHRLAAALDSKDPYKLTSRFSAQNYQDFVFDMRGIRNVWTGDFGGETRPGLSTIVGRIDPALAQRIFHALENAEESVAMLQSPLERETLPAPPTSAARQEAERAIADLKRFASLIHDAGAKMGIAVYLPN